MMGRKQQEFGEECRGDWQHEILKSNFRDFTLRKYVSFEAREKDNLDFYSFPLPASSPFHKSCVVCFQASPHVQRGMRGR